MQLADLSVNEHHHGKDQEGNEHQAPPLVCQDAPHSKAALYHQQNCQEDDEDL